MSRGMQSRKGLVRWLERYDQFAQATGFDVTKTAALAPAIAEIRAGRDAKATQVYSTTFDCHLSEAMAAVDFLKARISRT
jgi:hypothetical protein